MSTTIDERVVEMRFDANQFNNNIDTSIQSINKLNSSIDNMSSGKGLFNLGKAAEKVDFSKVEWAATHAGFHIEDVFEKATRFLENNIARRLVDWGTNIGKSLTIEPVFTGFNEYEQKMGSVQTIMNGANVSLEETMDTLEELNEYADKTIYSFSDMTSSIGKFTNAGVKLDDAVMAIKGISNEAAVSGANATEAGRAMYNIAQALSTGSMKLIDWKSIENANMATMEFKKTLIETGIELNSIRAGETSSLTAEELIADPSKFRASIEGVKGQTWVTDKVMIEALKKYADETTELGKKAYAAAQDVKTFTMLMDTLKEAAQSGWAVSMEKIIGDFEEAKQMWTAVSNEIGGLIDKSADERNKLLEEWNKGGGRQALLNSIANIWFTLKDSISTVKDAFQDIFPPITAERLLSITKTFEDFTAKVRAFMNSTGTISVVTNIFKGLFNVLKGGINILGSFFNTAKTVLGYVATAFSNVFKIDDSERFGNFLTNIGNKLNNIAISINKFFSDSDNAEKLITIFEGIAAGLQLIEKAITAIVSFGSNIFNKLFGDTNGASKIISNILNLFASVAEVIIGLNSGTITFGEAIKYAFAGVIGILKSAKESIVSFFNSINSSIDDGKIVETFNTIVNKIKELFGKLSGDKEKPKIGNNILSGLEDFKNKSKDILDKISENFKKFADKIKNFFNSLKDGDSDPNSSFLVKFLSILAKIIISLMDIIASALGMISGLFKGLEKEFQTNPFAGLIKAVTVSEQILIRSRLAGAVARILGSFKSLKDFGNVSPIELLKNMVEGLAKVANEKLPTTLGTMLTSFQTFFKGFGDLLTNYNKKIKKEANAALFKSVATSILMIAGAIALMGTIDVEELGPRIAAMTLVIGEMAILIAVLAKVSKSVSDIKGIGKLSILVADATTIAFAVVPLVKSMERLKGMDIPAIWSAFIAVSGLLWEMVGVTAIINKIDAKSFMNVSSSMVVMAFAINLLSRPLVKIGKELNIQQVIIGLAGIGIMLLELVKVSQYINKIRFGDVSGVLALSISLGILSAAFVKMSQLSWGEFGIGISSVTGLLAGLVIAVRMLKDSGLDLSTGASMLLMAASIGILAEALNKLSGIDADQLVQGWLALASTMLYLLGFMKFMPDTCIETALALIGVALALTVISSAIANLGNMDFMKMVQGLGGLAAAIGAIWLLFKVLDKNLKGAASLLIASVGLIVLAEALKIVGQLELASIAKGVIGLAGGLLVLVMAVDALSDPKMLLGAAALMIISVSLMAFGAAMLMLSLMSLADVGVALLALAGVLIIFGVAATALTPALIPMLGLATVLAIISVSIAIVGAGMMFLVSALTQIAIIGPDAANAMTALCTTISNNFKHFLQAATAISTLSTSLLFLGLALASLGLGLTITGVGVAVFSAALLVLAVALSVVSLAALVAAAAFAAIFGEFDRVEQGLTDVKDDFSNIGSDLLQSFKDGLKKGFKAVGETIKSIGKTILDSFKSIFGFGSEEAYDAGKSAGENYKRGLEDSKEDIEEEPKKEAKDEDFSIKDDITDAITSKILGDDKTKIDAKSLIDVDTSSIMGDTSSIMGNFGDIKNLTGDSSLNMNNMLKDTANTNSMMDQLGDGSSALASNTSDAADNMEKISNVDVSNVEALSDANLDGLTNEKTITDLDRTKDSIDAITDATEKSNEETLKINVDDSEIRKIADEIEKGLYGNGEERWIKLGAKFDAKTIAEAQNLVNQDFGVSKRHNPEEFNKYTKIAPSKNISSKEEARYFDYVNSVRERSSIYTHQNNNIPTLVAEEIQKQKLLFKKEILPTKDLSQEELGKQMIEINTKLSKIEKNRNERYNNRDLVEAAKKVEKQVEKTGNQIEKSTKSPEQLVRELGRLNPKAYYSSVEDTNDVGARDADNPDVRKNQQKRLAAFKEAIKSYENSTFMDDYNSDLLEELREIEQRTDETLKKKEAGNKALEQVLKSKSQFMGYDNTNDIESALAAKLDDGFKGIAKNSAKGGFKRLINEWKEDSEPIEVPVKTNANEATKQVNVLNEASNKTKDKKITITADTKSATKAVTEFSNGIKRMSTSVDVEASKTRQSFTRFYASLQQTINTYTPMIVANFKQTFKQAVDQTVNFMRSSSVIDQFRSIGENIGKGLAEGIRSQTATVRIAARQLSNAAVNASKSELKVKSPSEEFIAIGEFCGMGMAEGFKSSMGIVEEASKDLGASSINSIMNEMKQLDLDGIDTTPSIKPILDMGDVESKSGIIDAILNQQKAAKISSDIDNGDKQQRVQDQQMTEQLMIMNSRLEELTKNLESQEPTPVDVNVELQGDARTFFTVMRNQNKDYYRRTGKYAFQ